MPRIPSKTWWLPVSLTLAAWLPVAAVPADEHVEEVVVLAHPLSGEGLSQPVDVIEGDELARQVQASIGATLASQPGIHDSSFGQAASRPVVHGLSGARVRVMEDRIDTLDASVTSPDHAVSIEPFLADRIEILKGPATLLYGSGAIGGVVDVHTGRIPHEAAEVPLSGRLEMRRRDNAGLATGALRLDGGAASIAWHADVFARHADEYDVPGFATSGRVRDADDDASAARGRLPGSQLESAGGALGGSVVGDRGFAGLAVSVLSSRYGLPGGHGHEEVPGNPVLDLEQTRIDLEGALADPLSGFVSLNARAGINDYEHREIEPSGEVATTFANRAIDTRFELLHDEWLGWNGAFGVQYADREFSAIGEEAFVPPVDSRLVGAFWVGERSLGEAQLEAGVRVESVEHDPAGSASQGFTASAGSLGLVLPFDNGWRLALSMDYASRAPVSEELYSDGPHLATGSFEIGDPALDEESSLSFSATVDYSDDSLDLLATMYLMRFSDFIYARATGAQRDELPVFRYTQDDAQFSGVDVQVETTIAAWSGGRARFRGLFDTVTAELDTPGNDRLPRLPPRRYGVGLSVEWGRYDASIEYTLVEAVARVADGELPTDGYNDLRVYLGASVPFSGRVAELFVQGRNLTDDEQRNHSSFIKEFAPLPGRSLEAGLRLVF